jgi:hypothetical protein
MSSLTLTGLEPTFRLYVQYALDVLSHYGVRFTVTSAYRSPARQAELYAARSRNPYPVAPPGASAHNYGLAVDVTGPTPNDREAIRYVFAAIGLRTLPNDPVHWEWPGWQQLVRR